MLTQALQAHQQGRLDEALSGYLQVVRADPKPPPPCFMNAAAILRQQAKPDEGAALLLQGLDRYPGEPGLWNNLGTCYRDLERRPNAIHAFRRALRLNPAFVDARLSLAMALRQQGLLHLAYATLLLGVQHSSNAEDAERFYQPLVEVLLSLPAEQRGSNDSLVKLVETLEQKELDDPRAPGRRSMMVAQIWMQLDECKRALASRDRAMQQVQAFLTQSNGLSLKSSFHKQWHNFNWNLSIFLLRNGDLQQGWQLYDHGLQVPAEGSQRWQRSLFKPFTPQQLTFWRGESLAGKRLLLLGEQGIGDSMMFATLLPALQREGAQIFLAPGDRLLTLYRRSLPDVRVLSSAELRNGTVPPSSFDLQCPLGSVVQYRFHHYQDFAPRSPFLVADPVKTAALRCAYQNDQPQRPLIGISWQGGGKPKRIEAKSIKLKDLQPLFESSQARFVSLQYGDDAPHLDRFAEATGIRIHHDDTINPLKDMDTWHSQVAAMDAVISIANTTIHGAGGLGVPTLCLVSRQADWRWVKPDIHRGCYWYPSVDAVYQSDDGSWQEALREAGRWLAERFPAFHKA